MHQSHLASMSPKFISFEGTEGVGKTTAIDHFCHYLSSNHIGHVRTREPGGSQLAEDLRHRLLDKASDFNDDTELLLMFAARADHLYKVILPALARGDWVVCDRFVDSTVAYQGFGRYHGNKESLHKIHLLCQQFVPVMPQITFWLDLEVRLGMARAGRRGEADRFEREDVAFFERVYQGFLYQYQQNTGRICRIDAQQPPQAVVSAIIEHLLNKNEL